MTPTTATLPRHHRTWFQFSAAAVLVAIVGLAGGRAQAHPPAQGGHAGLQPGAHHRMAGGLGMAGMAMPERMLDAVGASAEQKTRLREIFQAAGQDMRAQHQAGRTLQAQMLALMAAPQVDAAAAEALRQQQLARHDSATKRALQAMLDAQAVLTPDQRAKLAERMAARQDMRAQRRAHRQEHRHEHQHQRQHQQQRQQEQGAPAAPRS